jgi:hypothetical protein
MPSNENKDPLKKLTDKINFFMGQHDPKKATAICP